MLDERTARRLQGQAKAREKVELQARAPPPSVCVLSSQSTRVLTTAGMCRVHSPLPVCVYSTINSWSAHAFTGTREPGTVAGYAHSWPGSEPCPQGYSRTHRASTLPAGEERARSQERNDQDEHGQGQPQSVTQSPTS